jgi:hypothetical protein
MRMITSTTQILSNEQLVINLSYMYVYNVKWQGGGIKIPLQCKVDAVAPSSTFYTKYNKTETLATKYYLPQVHNLITKLRNITVAIFVLTQHQPRIL